MTETIEFKMKLLRVESIRELQVKRGEKWERRIGMVYFQYIPDGGFITRIITEKTDGPWLVSQVNKRLIYVPENPPSAELS